MFQFVSVEIKRGVIFFLNSHRHQEKEKRDGNLYKYTLFDPPKGMNNYSYLYYLLSNDSTFPKMKFMYEISMVKWNDATASIGRTTYSHQIKTQFWNTQIYFPFHLSLSLSTFMLFFTIFRTFTNKRKIILHSFWVLMLMLCVPVRNKKTLFTSLSHSFQIIFVNKTVREI